MHPSQSTPPTSISSSDEAPAPAAATTTTTTTPLDAPTMHHPSSPSETDTTTTTTATTRRYHDYGATADCGVNLTLAGSDAAAHAWLARARTAGVAHAVLIGHDLPSTRAAARACADPTFLAHGVRLCFTAGVHPLEAASWSDAAEEELGRLAAHPACVAVGEAGLDHSPTERHPARPTPPRSLQAWAFKRQVALARRLRLPLYLHEREAHEDFLAVLAEEGGVGAGAGGVRGLVHCFNSGAASLRAYVALGLKVGVSSLVACGEKGAALRAALRAARPSLGDVVVETDAPFLRPERVPREAGAAEGRANEPCLLPLVVLGLADCLGLFPRDVAASTLATATGFFGLDNAKRAAAAAVATATAATEAPPPSPSPPPPCGSTVRTIRFVAPLLLRHLVYSLRGLSIDTALVRHNDMAGVEQEAQRTGRILLARHTKRLTAGGSGAPVSVHKVDTDETAEQLCGLLLRYGLRPTLAEVEAGRRCTSCNTSDWEVQGTETRDAGAVLSDALTLHAHLCRCRCCGKTSFLPSPEKRAETHANLLLLLDGQGAAATMSAAEIAKQARFQRRSVCAYWNGLPGSCRNGNSCEWLHGQSARRVNEDGSKRRDDVHVVPVHARHGVLLLKGLLANGPQWAVPSRRFAADATAFDAAVALASEELGVPRAQAEAALRPASDACTGESLDSGRRTYYVLRLSDADEAPPGVQGARLPANGGGGGSTPAYWLRTSRPFSFHTDLAAAGRLVKISGAGSPVKGDVQGAVALKALGFDGRLRRVAYAADAVPSSGAPPPQAGAQAARAAALRAAASLTRAAADVRLGGLLGSLRARGVRGATEERARWEVPKSGACAAAAACGERAAGVVVRRQAAALGRSARARLGADADAGAVAEKVRRFVEERVRGVWERGGGVLRLFGSAATGAVGKDGFDVDLWLGLPGSSSASASSGGGAAAAAAEAMDRHEECATLRRLHELLIHQEEAQSAADGSDAAAAAATLSLPAARLKLTLGARVPVVSGTVEGKGLPGGGVPIDITLRRLGCVNTALFRLHYARHPFLRRLSLVVKAWAAWAGIRRAGGGGDAPASAAASAAEPAAQQGLSSYTLMLMMLHALVATGAVPAVSLEDAAAAAAAATEEAGGGVGYAEDCGEAADEVVMEHFEVFLRYYSFEFAYDTHVVAVGTADGAALRKDDPLWDGGAEQEASGQQASAPLCVRDPFEVPTLNLTRHLKQARVGEIVRRVRLSYHSLREGTLAEQLSRAVLLG